MAVSPWARRAVTVADFADVEGRGAAPRAEAVLRAVVGRFGVTDAAPVGRGGAPRISCAVCAVGRPTWSWGVRARHYWPITSDRLRLTLVTPCKLETKGPSHRRFRRRLARQRRPSRRGSRRCSCPLDPRSCLQERGAAKSQSDEANTQTSTTLSAIVWGLVRARRATAVDDSVAEWHARAVEAGRAVAAADAAGVDLLCVGCTWLYCTCCVCWICCVRCFGLVIYQDSAITVWQ
jgi:hypothetical protein